MKLWTVDTFEMPPEVSRFRSASPENMEEPSISDGLKMNDLDRKSSVGFKEPSGTSKSNEKERQMIGRADQVYDPWRLRMGFQNADSIQMEQVCHPIFHHSYEKRDLMPCKTRQKRRFEYFEMRPPKPRKFKFTKYVILVRRRISGKGMPTGVTEVDVRGSLLQQALSDMHTDTEGFSFDDDPPQVLSYAPSRPLVSTKNQT